MKKAYPHLLSPIMVGKHLLKNRMEYPNASPHTLMGPETFPAEGFRDFHVNLARNGAAIVTIAEWNNLDQHKGPYQFDFTHMQAFDMKDPSTHNYFSLMAEEIHFYGSKLLIHASVDMPEGYSLYGGKVFGPGVPPDAPEAKPLPKEMMPQVIEAFLEKMHMYKIMGFDGLSMRTDMELLPEHRSREDEYSSDTVENRTRFIRDIYAAVKERFGDDFITESIVAWEQPWGYGWKQGPGVNSDEVAEFCHLIDKDVDIFQIREKDATRSHPTGFNFKQGDHPAVDFAARLKSEGITALLEPIGGFQEPEEMEEILADGKCDLFGMARAFMADYEYGQKMQEGRSDEITPCLKCNKCHGTMLPEPEPWITMCSVNPIHGIRHELPRMIFETSAKKVAVIGGGAAGMRAAIESAKRGHSVTLFEKTDKLGGQLLHADYFDFKWPIKNYKEWMIRELDRLGVTVKMNSNPTPEEIEETGFDAVLAATGAVAVLPKSIEGLCDEEGKALYPTSWDIWGKEAELGKHIIMVGGSETGIETAIYLLRAGHKVTVLTRQKEVAHDASKLHYITMAFVKQDDETHAHEAAEWERYDEFTGIVNATTKSVSGNSVTYVDAEGKEQTISGDAVVICGGTRRLTEEALSYRNSAVQFYAIGDCLPGAGNIQRCTRQAFARANMI